MQVLHAKTLLGAGALALALALLGQGAFAGPLLDWVVERQAAREQHRDEQAGIHIVRDVPYGSDARQRFDVYTPRQAKDAPVIFMVHGGAWKIGDKAVESVVENKVARWVAKGFVFISTNYRMLPDADPLEQARDVARAVAVAQGKVAGWGGDPSRFILMGHSAGAHLVALLDTSPDLAASVGAVPWLGTVVLDSAALDVVTVMQARHARFYDQAFGNAPAYWKSASPYYAVTRAARPLLLVCSTRRDNSCAQADRFAARAASLGVAAPTLKMDLSHREINQVLGKDERYTEAVEAFMARLDPVVGRLLAAPSTGVEAGSP